MTYNPDLEFEQVVNFNNNEVKKSMQTTTPWYMSSANPLDLSLTIKGALMMYVPIALTMAQNYNVPLSNTLAVELVNDISFAIAALIIIGGLVRKLYKRFK